MIQEGDGWRWRDKGDAGGLVRSDDTEVSREIGLA